MDTELNNSYKPVGLDKTRLLKLMKEHSLDGIFLSSPENVFYTTGYPSLPSSGNPIGYALRNQLPYFSYLGSDGQITLFCWGAAAMGVDYGADDLRMYFTYQMALDELVGFIEEKLHPGCQLGLESSLPYFAVKLIGEHALPARVELADPILHQLRLIKSAAEVERIRRATQIVDQTVLELAHNLRLGMSRLELIREAKWRMIKNGADGVDHVTVAFGSANPEVALAEPLEENQIITLDLGAVYEGYASDNRRIAYTGAPPAALLELHGKMCRVVADVGKALRPGYTFSDLYTLGTELFAREGLDPMFMHVGHSIGLQVDEHWIMADDPTPVEKGMVLNIELYSPSDEGVMVGDEETYVITDVEPLKLSTLDTNIIKV